MHEDEFKNYQRKDAINKNKLFLFDLYGTLVDFENVKLVDGVREFLHAAKEKGYVLGVVTSCEETDIVKSILENDNVDHMFSFIVSGNESKTHEGRLIIAIETARKVTGQRFDGKDIFHFDDDERRISGTHKVGIQHVAVMDMPRLTAYIVGADFLINNFSKKTELIQFLENNTSNKEKNTKKIKA